MMQQEKLEEAVDDAIVEVLKELRDPEVGNRILARAIRRRILPLLSLTPNKT